MPGKNIKKHIAFLLIFCVIISQLSGNIFASTAQQQQIQTSTMEQIGILRGDNESPIYFKGDSPRFLAGNEWESKFKAMVLDGIKNYKTSIDISSLKIDFNTQKDRVKQLYMEVLESNADIFYANTAIRFNYFKNSYIDSVQISYIQEFLNPKTGEVDSNLVNQTADKVNQGIISALADVDTNMSTVEKVLALHEWIVKTADYDYTNLNNNSVPDRSYSPYGVFRDGVAVCQGYALAYSYLLQQIGIDSYVVASKEINHAWNLVNVDGNWYNVDTTWDDPVFEAPEYEDGDREGFGRHTYFLLSDKEFAESHPGGYSYNGYTTLPKATVENSYNGYSFRNLDSILSYSKGFWYYGDGNIYKIRIDSDKPVAEYTAMSPVNYLNIVDGTMYWATPTDIRSAPVENPNQSKEILTTQGGMYAGYTIAEFSLKANQFRANMYKKEADGFHYQHAIWDYSHNYEKEDTNHDGIIDIFDITAIRNYILGYSHVSEEEIAWLDVNQDGDIDIFDIVAIQNKILRISK